MPAETLFSRLELVFRTGAYDSHHVVSEIDIGPCK